MTPSFDSAGFSRWLRKWKDHDGRTWQQIADAAGIHAGTLQQLARGAQSGNRSGSGGAINPSAQVIARLAHALGLETNYVMRKAGLAVEGERWSNFTRLERIGLLSGLASIAEHDPIAANLRQELAEFHNNEGE